MVYSALSDDASTVSQFTRRRDITVTTNGTNTPANYQTKLTITYEAGMQADFDDIRFNTRAGGYIDYWIESYVASTSAVVWVELPDAITDPGLDTIWMYYGNDSLSDGGDGDDTFTFFDNFDSWDTDKWTGAYTSITDGIIKLVKQEIKSITTYSYGNIVTIRAKPSGHTDNSSQTELGYGSYYENNATTIRIYGKLSGTMQIDTRTINSSSQTLITRLNSWTETYKQYTSIIVSSSSSFFKYDGNTWAQTTNVPTTAIPVMIKARPDLLENIEIDWVFVRKYIANEPTLSYGTAQHQRRIPTFIG